MIRRPTLWQRLARASLLLAAVLQFGAVTVGPYWHLSPQAPRSEAASESGGDRDPASPAPPHSEQACYVCQTLTGVAVLPLPSVGMVLSVVPARETPEQPWLPRTSWTSSTLARAPPLA